MSAAPLMLGDESLERQNEKLRRITEALMRRVEGAVDGAGSGYAAFQAAVALESTVRARTRELQAAMAELEAANARLAVAQAEAEGARADLANALEVLREGFALFSPDDRLLLCNSRFSEFAPDVRREIRPGISFADYVSLVAASEHLKLRPGETRGGWRLRRLSAHRRTEATLTVELSGDLWVQVSERRTPDGGCAIIQTDVTHIVRRERREREKLVDEQARLVRATLDHVVQGVAVFDGERRLAASNARLGELLALPVELLTVGSSVEAMAAHLQRGRTFAEAEPPRRLLAWFSAPRGRPPIALGLRRADGVALEAHGAETPDGGLVVTVSDVTAETRALEEVRELNETLESRVATRTAELREARDAAEQANRSKTRFLAAASHDLLQPLNAAKLFAGSLARTRLDEQQARLVGDLRSAFDSVEELFGEILEIARLDSGPPPPALEEFPLSRILAPLRSEFGAIAARKGLELRVVPSGLTLRSDPIYLRRIVQNFVSNAVRYTPRGRVLVGVRRRGGLARIDVVDMGPGVPEADRAKIFEEFSRLRRPSAGEAFGLGLGLAIAERAARLLGAAIELDSREGAGSRFSVSAPIAREAPADRDPPAVEESTETLVLVAGADGAARGELVEALDRWGVGALGAASLAEAERCVDDLGVPPDLILLLDDLAAGAETALARLRARCPSSRFGVIRNDARPEPADDPGVLALPSPLRPSQLRATLAWAAAARDAAGAGAPDGPAARGAG